MSLSLVVGDRLVYPNQGLCTVTEIKTEEIAGSRLVFVSLTIIETGARVKVPQEKLVKNGVRRVSGPDDVKRVFDFLRGESERASLDWKKRARDNTARLSEGGLLGLAEIVKGLQELSELRPLPPKEREQYNDARHLFVEELAAAHGCSPADAEDALDIVLFPPGKDRPKRSIEEFQLLAGEDDLGLGGDDLLGIDGEEPAEAEEKEEKGEEGEDGEDADDGEEAGAAKKKKPGRPAAPKAVPAAAGATAAKGLKALLAAVEAHAPPAAAEPAAPKKRGRPPKAKPAPDPSAPPPEPKKRGRPPKAKAPAAEVHAPAAKKKAPKKGKS